MKSINISEKGSKMRDLKILFGDRIGASVPMDSLRRELAKLAKCRFVSPDSIELKVANPYDYDMLIIGPFASDLNLWKAQRLNIPKIMICSDPQSDIAHHIYYAKAYKVNNMFMIYPSWIKRYREDYAANYVPFTWWSDDYYKEVPKTVNVMYAVANTPLYPVRYEMEKNPQIMRSFGNVIRCGTTDARLPFLDYINKLNKAKVFAFDGSFWRMGILKYVEAMCLKSAIVAPISSDLPYLRLWEDNYEHATQSSVFDAVKQLLKDEQRREDMTTKARELFLKHHTTEIRAKQMIEYIERILNGEICLDGSNTVWTSPQQST